MERVEETRVEETRVEETRVEETRVEVKTEEPGETHLFTSTPSEPNC